MKTLYREKTEQTQAMKNGLEFERLVWECACGKKPDETHKWIKGVREIAKRVSAGAYQAALSTEEEIGGERYLLYGIADFVKQEIIFDVKFSSRYQSRGNPNYYLTSPQAPMYLKLLPQAEEFVYLISDGQEVFEESYTREELPDIENTISSFADNIKRRGLWETYTALWRADKERR